MKDLGETLRELAEYYVKKAKQYEDPEPRLMAAMIDSETLFEAYLMSARRVDCPKCKAKRNEACIFNGKRRQNLVHRDRKS